MRNSHKHYVFVARILERDNFQCQHCYTTENLHIHHIKKVKQYPQFQYEVNNGITLCSKCHKIFENWVDAPWNKWNKICQDCGKEYRDWWEPAIPFKKLWEGHSWVIRETTKKYCRNEPIVIGTI